MCAVFCLVVVVVVAFLKLYMLKNKREISEAPEEERVPH